MNRLVSSSAFGLVTSLSSLLAQEPAPMPAPPVTQSPPAKGLQWKVGEFDVKLGGYVKVDLIHDFDEIGSTDSFDPRTIPTNDEDDPGMNTRLHARSTRLNLDVRGPTSEGDLRIFVEGDFFGDGNAFRLRHAFGTLGGVLGGQTWSTFMDEDCMPETLDFESPIAFPLIRQAQIRYRGEITKAGSYWAVAVEDPASRQLATATPGEVEEATPDFCGRVRWAHGMGHCQLGVFGGTARFDPDAAPAETVVLYGMNFSTRLDVCERDHFFFQGTYGPGVGRYRGGFTAALDSSGNLEPIDVLGFMVAYEHHWSAKWRSTASYSWGEGELPTGVPVTGVVENLEYAAANLIYQFSNRSWAGVEYLYGSREDQDGSFGRANRLQFAVRFDI
ncbi:MAG TPA: DcaP family trimeric outer membrane transporter [Planctomycetota bacterium]|nr:DcaP family trimeric outer membrane transporter [Planctomycetota bacterium]